MLDEHGHTIEVCPNPFLNHIGGSMKHNLWRVNGLMLVNAALMGIVVSLGVCAPRARRNPLLGLILLGASTLFLPIVSNVVATIGNDMYFTSSLYNNNQVVAARCEPGMHAIIVLVWTTVVITIGVTSSIVVVTDAREGRSVQTPTELLIQAIWVVFLIIIAVFTTGYVNTMRYIGGLLGNGEATKQVDFAVATVMLLPFAKIILKHYAFKSAKRKVAFGRSNRLIVGWSRLCQRRNIAQRSAQHLPPELLFLKKEQVPPELLVWVHEEYYKVVAEHDGFSLLHNSMGYGSGSETAVHNNDGGPGTEIGGHNNNGDRSGSEIIADHNNKGNGSGSEFAELVTLDKVWKQSFLEKEHKDLCFSFALFKLLRCRFAKYTVYEAGFMKAQSFFRQEYLSVIGDNHDRVFRVIADELSFINSYYNSSLPIYCAYASIFKSVSLLSISLCLFLLVFISRALNRLRGQKQVICFVWCPGRSTREGSVIWGSELRFGSAFFGVIPVYLVVAILLISEVKDFVYYHCSNWTKVNRICRYLRLPPLKRKRAPPVKNRGDKLVNSWGDKMRQCSILVQRPWWKPKPHFWSVPGLPLSRDNWYPLWRLVSFPKEEPIKDQKAVKKSIFRTLKKYLYNHKEAMENISKVEKLSAVKVSIFRTLQKYLDIQKGTVMELITPPSPPVEIAKGDTFFSTSGCRSVADTILAWHIATGLFELQDQEQPYSDNKTAATVISRYCAYLVACRPELLPDQDEWCKKLYANVLKKAHRIVRAVGKGAGFKQLVDKIEEAEWIGTDVPPVELDGRNVIKNGMGIAKELVQKSIEWGQLADFWSEMILYIAPSENFDAHAEAIARGDEMVTLLWALLTHAGVVDRIEESDASTTNNRSAEDAPSASGDHNV